MGKKAKAEGKYTTASTFKINKSKSLGSNLSEYLKLLKNKYAILSTRQYLHSVHRFFKNYSQKKGSLPQQLVIENSSKIKICIKCDKWAVGNKNMLQCFVCEDYYHLSCTNQPEWDEEWACVRCIQNCGDLQQEQKEVQQDTQKSCASCPIQLKSSVKCLRCFKFFHKKCFGSSHVVCADCDKDIELKIKKQSQKQLTLRESFKLAQKKQSDKKKSELTQGQSGLTEQRRRSTLVMFGRGENSQQIPKKVQKKQIQQKNESTYFQSVNTSLSKRFKQSFPKMSPQQISKYKESLMYAILSKNMEYCEELVPQYCSLDDNNEDSVDFGLNSLIMSDFKLFKEYKKQPIGPFLLSYKQKCGYDVIADKDLPKGMIICEYVGDVYSFRKIIQLKEQKNDSIMELKKGKNADESLLIVPKHYTNIARFLNGVNESDPKRFEKQNVDNIRVLVNGRPAVILYTCRAVIKGESLLYNYGAGMAKTKYDTSSYE